MRNDKLINEWLEKRNIKLEIGFAEMLRLYAIEYKITNNINIGKIYAMLGCSKQNVSYWEIHCDSTQSKKSILSVVHAAQKLFKLSEDDAEKLANSAGLSLYYEGGSLLETLNYSGRICELGANALISERMLRHYKKNSHEAGAYGNFDLLGFIS